jgi:phosphocarrier protein FPr
VEGRREANPFLGVRGLRLGLAQPELLVTQLRAALRAGAGHQLRIMFPMVAVLDEWQQARALVARAGEGITPPQGLQLGVMVEVPSLPLIADRVAPLVDFFSIGTNDLTQYTLAAERGNPALGALADALHPAVLALIERTCRAADEHGRWVGVCGELAADPLAVPVLVGMGVTELSMNAVAVPSIKQVVRRIDTAAARDLAARALTMASAEEVRLAAREFLEE